VENLPPSNQGGPLPTEPKRLRAFATFFKSYMNVWAIVVAALPVPLTALKLIPVYKEQSGVLSTFTTLFCFLLLGYIFFSRHAIARWMFRDVLDEGWGLTRTMSILPLILILLSLTFAGLYYYVMTISLRGIHLETSSITDTTAYVLNKIPLAFIPDGLMLMISYLLCFLLAEAAFILMAIREYLQDLLGITELELIKNRPRDPVKRIRSKPSP